MTRDTLGIVMYLIAVAAIGSTWALFYRYDRERWRINTGRLGLLLGIVTLGFYFFVFPNTR